MTIDGRPDDGPEIAGMLHAYPYLQGHGQPSEGQHQPFSWAEIFGDPVAVAAMVDRLVHRAEVIVLKGESYRLRLAGGGADRREGALRVLRFQPAIRVQGLDRR